MKKTTLLLLFVAVFVLSIQAVSAEISQGCYAKKLAVTTEDYRGGFVDSVEMGDKICAKELGEGWEWLEHHEDGGWAARGQLLQKDYPKRAWVHINDQDAECFSTNNQYGMTWNVDFQNGCGWATCNSDEGFDRSDFNPFVIEYYDSNNEKQYSKCNAYEGDTPCDELRPLLCVYKGVPDEEMADLAFSVVQIRESNERDSTGSYMVEINPTIKNKGDIRSDIFGFETYIDGELKMSANGYHGLNPGETIGSDVLGFSIGLEQGTHAIKLVINPQGEDERSDNNVYVSRINIEGSDVLEEDPAEDDSSIVHSGRICKDSDGGLNYYKKGTITEGVLASADTSPRTDQCLSDTRLREMFCNSEAEGEPRLYECPHGCSNGACVESIEEAPAEEVLEEAQMSIIPAGFRRYTGSKLQEGETITYHIYGKELELTLLDVEEDEAVAKLQANGRVLRSFKQGYYEILSGYFLILAKDINPGKQDAYFRIYIREDLSDAGSSDGACEERVHIGYVLENGECVEKKNKGCSEFRYKTKEECIEAATPTLIRTELIEESGYDGERIVPINEKVCKEGCLFQKTCIDSGIRFETKGTPSYCGIFGDIEEQRDAGDSCQNSFECKSNLCADGVCSSLKEIKEGIDEGIGEVKKANTFLNKLLDFFRGSWFGRVIGVQ